MAEPLGWADLSDGERVIGHLTAAALVGLSDVALDARLQYVSGGAMLDERYYASVKALVFENDQLRAGLWRIESKASEIARVATDG